MGADTGPSNVRTVSNPAICPPIPCLGDWAWSMQEDLTVSHPTWCLGIGSCSN